MKWEIRLGDEDRATYGGDEWLEFDPSVYDDMPLAELSALERQMHTGGGVSLFNLLTPGGEIGRQTAVGRVSAAWLARQQAGLTEPAFAEFKVKHLEMTGRLNKGPTVPLGEGSPTPGEPEPESSEQSPETAPPKRRSRSSSQR